MSADAPSATTIAAEDRIEASPFCIATARVVAVDRVSPNFVRIGFGGDDIDRLGTPGRTFDQRIKLVFPGESGVLPRIEQHADWYRAWLDVPAHERGSMRTYSIRDLQTGTPGRPGSTVLVVDFVLHLEPGLTGPASRWADRAAIGDEVLVVGPRRGRTDTGGIEFAPDGAPTMLLAGDETAAPAIARILEDIDRDAIGIAFIEVAVAADALPINAPRGVEVRWLPRDGCAHGERLIPAVLGFMGAGEHAIEVDDGDPDGTRLADDALLWETPAYSGLGEALPTAATHADRYYWIAGESGVVTTLRRHLVRDVGIDRAQVAFMGYWRRGVAMKG